MTALDRFFGVFCAIGSACAAWNQHAFACVYLAGMALWSLYPWSNGVER